MPNAEELVQAFGDPGLRSRVSSVLKLGLAELLGPGRPGVEVLAIRTAARRCTAGTSPPPVRGDLLNGSFSAVSTPIFAIKLSFFSIFQDLQELHTFAPLLTQFFGENHPKFSEIYLKILAKFRFEESAIFEKNQQQFCKCCKICKSLPNFLI